jgi:Alpha 1,4-glycosyltransferase conserved region
MLKQNHAVRLFVYDRIDNVPDGIEVVDANQILHREKLLIYSRTNSPALGANIFRYKLMKMNLGLWLDTDVILIKSIEKKYQSVFGFEDDKLINNAVLFIPSASPLLTELIKYVSCDYPVPPFYKLRKRIELRLRKLAGVPVHARDMRWGVFGPDALTYFVQKQGLTAHAAKPEVFYPIHAREAHSLFSDQCDVRHLIRPATLTVHLYNEMLRRPSQLRPNNPVGKLIVDRGSFVAEFARKELGFRLQSE